MAEAFPIHHEDEAHPEQVKKKGRFTKAWRSVFRESVVEKESIESTRTVSRGLFFERGVVDQKSPEAARRAAKTIIETLPKQEAGQQEFTQERIYNVTPDLKKFVEKHEVNEANEKANELSHEHKDMDKQSWTAMQQAAYEQSQANAAALAAAQQQVQQAKIPAKDDISSRQVSVVKSYQRLVTYAFVSLAALFALIIVILLIQSK